MECEKLAQEKTEMQRHYVMVSVFFFLFYNFENGKIKCGFSLFQFQYYEMSYGLNVEMHKQVRDLILFWIFILQMVRYCRLL